jgi:hypothetical protein
MKTQKISKLQEVATHTTPSTDPEKTRERQGQAERMAKGQAKWSLSGKRTDGAKKEE